MLLFIIPFIHASTLLPINSARFLLNTPCHLYQIRSHFRPIHLHITTRPNSSFTAIFTDAIPDQQCATMECPAEATICQGLSIIGTQQEYETSFSNKVCVSQLYLLIKVVDQISGQLVVSLPDQQDGCQIPNWSVGVDCAQSIHCGNVQMCSDKCYKTSCTYLDQNSGINYSAAEYCLPYYTEDASSVCEDSLLYNLSQNKYATREYCGGEQSGHIPTSMDEVRHLTWVEMIVMLGVILSSLLVCGGIWYRHQLRRTGEAPFEVPRRVGDWLGGQENEGRQERRRSSIQLQNRG